MIQGSTIRAVMGRDDAVVWPIESANTLTSPSGITRCVIHCRRDGEQDVIIDSQDVPAAFVFDYDAVINGGSVKAMKWSPGVAVIGKFVESGQWKADVFLFDSVHTSGIYHGRFTLAVTDKLLTDLLLHFDGTNGQTTTVDDGRFHFPVTSFGGAALSTAQKKFGSSSFAGGAGKYFRVDTQQYTQFGNTDFTIECFARLSAYQQRESAFATTSTWYFAFFTNTASGAGAEGNYISFYTVRNGSAHFDAAPFTPSLNTWYHCAVARQGSVLRLFVDGILRGTIIIGSEPIDASEEFFYMGNPVQANFGGSPGNPNQYINGFLEEFRITFGKAVYTTNFTPPVAPFE